MLPGKFFFLFDKVWDLRYLEAAVAEKAEQMCVIH